MTFVCGWRPPMKRFGRHQRSKRNSPRTGTADAFSEFISSGFETFPEVLNPIWDEINEIYGTDHKPELK